ncbi:MAG TPA: helix-turn-helix domain-containing protein [Kofleriaceae bacterium]|nr:helix-turn-helix domain-containing protein [Kofleriaceae bacterium]
MVGPLVPPRRVPPSRPGPAGGARDANRRARTQQISEAALDLFLEHGLLAVTIDQIVERAGVGKGSFYRYFGDKEELVVALFAELAAGVTRAFDACRDALARARNPAALSGAYLALAQEIATVLAAQPRVALLYLQESRGPATGARAPVRQLADRVADLAEMLSAHARDHGLLRDIDARVQALVVLGAVERLLFDAFSGRGIAGRTDAVAAMVVSIILDGVRR